MLLPDAITPCRKHMMFASKPRSAKYAPVGTSEGDVLEKPLSSTTPNTLTSSKVFSYRALVFYAVFGILSGLLSTTILLLQLVAPNCDHGGFPTSRHNDQLLLASDIILPESERFRSSTTASRSSTLTHSKCQ